MEEGNCDSQGLSWTVVLEEEKEEEDGLHVYWFVFVYIVMNSSLNGNCGSCSYFTWFLQNAYCADFQSQRFLNDCLFAVGTIIACKILHTSAVALCTFHNFNMFIWLTVVCSCIRDCCHSIPWMKYTSHSPVFSKVCHSWTVLLCHLWILASSEPSCTKTVYTQLLPVLTTFCIPTSQCNKVLAHSCGEAKCILDSWCPWWWCSGFQSFLVTYFNTIIWMFHDWFL
jgi:hypothetical protein